MPNYARGGLKLKSNRSYGVINPDLKILVQILVSMYSGDQVRGTAVSMCLSIMHYHLERI